MKRKCLDSALNGLNLCSFFCQMVKVMIQMCGLCWLTRHNEQVSVVVLPQRLHHPRSWCQTQWCPLCWWQPGHFWRAAWSLSSYNPLWWWRSSSPRWEQHDAICAARREKWFETPARRFKFQVCQVSLVMVLSGYLATCAKELVCLPLSFWTPKDKDKAWWLHHEQWKFTGGCGEFNLSQYQFWPNVQMHMKFLSELKILLLSALLIYFNCYYL